MLYINSGQAWPSAASPEAKHVKGYLCPSKEPWRPSTHAFKVPRIQLLQPHKAIFVSRFWLKVWGKNRKQLHKDVRPSADVESACCGSKQHVVNIKVTSKPEHRQRDTLSLCLQRLANMLILCKKMPQYFLLPTHKAIVSDKFITVAVKAISLQPKRGPHNYGFQAVWESCMM